MASVKISELNELFSITNDDFFPLVDSGSMTTFHVSFNVLNAWMRASGSCLSASWASSSISSSYALSASYANTAKTASYVSGVGNADEATHATTADTASLAEDAQGVYLKRTTTPHYQWLTMWSGSNTTTLDRTGISDGGVQYNVAKPVFFNLISESADTDSATCGPLRKVYAELRQGTGTYNQWLTLSYLYSGGGDPGWVYTGPAGAGENPDVLFGVYGDPELGTYNLRMIPDPEVPDNHLDETGIGSQLWTEYFRSQRYWAWYVGGSFMGHSDTTLTPGISSSTAMVLNGNAESDDASEGNSSRLGIGNFYNGHPNSAYNYPSHPLHISASTSVIDGEVSVNSTASADVSILRLDQLVGDAAELGTVAGYITINVSGRNYKIALNAAGTAGTSGTIPIGSVIDFAGETIPTGWLLCDGSAVSRTGDYESLFTAIGTSWGVGDGATTFNLPNLTARMTISSGSSYHKISGSLGNTGGGDNLQNHYHFIGKSAFPFNSEPNGGTCIYDDLMMWWLGNQELPTSGENSMFPEVTSPYDDLRAVHYNQTSDVATYARTPWRSVLNSPTDTGFCAGTSFGTSLTSVDMMPPYAVVKKIIRYA